MKRSNLHGFSLIELVFAMGIFSIISVLIFAFFRFGTRSFSRANEKHGLQTDALRVAESLQLEMKRTNRSSVRILPVNDTSDGEAVRRDVVSFISLKDWKAKGDDDNFDRVTRAPLWNRYVIFYATGEDIGRLIRLRADPNPAPNAPVRIPTDDLDKLHFDNPSLNRIDGEVPEYIELSKSVFSFETDEVKLAGRTTGEYDILLKLKQKRSRDQIESAEAREYDHYELSLRIRPENSFPEVP
ncbi:MAG TPA: prepilin-type N-terminal cleavage/methylation domain-containing protein [Phycisphaerales bacterium]|nr:prepilin-type N-terminal cleavage/methylation domain-containing protein [Phycisphaerales bacterium]